MRKNGILILLFVIIAALTQWLVIKYIPNIVHAIAVRRAHVRNKWINNTKTDATMRSVVLPNPDFIYSALFYDVRAHGITVKGIFPESAYASVAFYDDRCQPYYVYNNLSEERKGAFEFQISNQEVTGATQLKAKTGTGVIICRFLVKGDSAFTKIKRYQQQLVCEVK